MALSLLVFLALGNDVMDDVHLFAVVDTGVRVSIPEKRTIHF